MQMYITGVALIIGTGTSGSGQFSSTSSSPDLGISTGDVSQGELLYMRTGGDGCSGGIASGTGRCVCVCVYT